MKNKTTQFHWFNLFKKHIGKEKIYEFAIVLQLILALYYLFFSRLEHWLFLSVVISGITIIKLDLMKPFALIWYEFAEILGKVMSTIIMSVLYITIVIPVGVLQRLLSRHDKMQLRSFKKGTDSVFINRNHRFESNDFEHQF